jgi:uncharacterized membrane protein
MKASDILKKTVYYFLLAVASTMFFYFSIRSSLYFYSSKGSNDALSEANILIGIYLPSLLALLSLAVALLDQLRVLHIKDANEKRLYGIALIVYFGVMFLAMIALLVYEARNNASIGMVCLIPLFLFSLLEIAYGIYKTVEGNKGLICEENSANH